MGNQNPDGSEDINYDGFGDITSSQNGIFGMNGLEPTLKKHDSIKHEIADKGLLLEFYCQGCGAPTQVMVEYPELISMRYGVNPAVALRGQQSLVEEPTNWQFVPAEQSWRPDMKCPHCSFNICIRVGAAEPDHHLANARRRGFVPAQMEQQVSALASTVANRLRASGPR
jgi:hypothetical protein